MIPPARPRRPPALLLGLAVLSSATFAAAQSKDDFGARFDWDLISLEQNNRRFNGSVLSGFHSVRSPGVTPAHVWKAGVGLLYSGEEQVASARNTTRTFSTDVVTVNPKVNYGFLGRFEIGGGAELVYAEGSTVDRDASGVTTDRDDNFNVSAAVAGLKCNFYRADALRLAAAADSRIATRKEQFGMLPATLYNVELDADYAFTSRFSMVSNLQFMTSDSSLINDQVIFDLSGEYSFSSEFRGMLFGTVQEDDQADDPVYFIGFAGQYAIRQHAFTVAVDFQLNDARREVRTDSQIDLEVSYAVAF